MRESVGGGQAKPGGRPCALQDNLARPVRACRVKLSVRFQGGPPGRSRRRLGAHAFAPAGAPATAAPTPVGWREKRKTPGCW